ncbi:MAG: response regulator [Desulfatiglandaceae bacterium]
MAHKNKRKVLVIDNDHLMREFIKDLLTQEGYEVATAENGLAALDILKTSVPDFIFLDLVMPRIDGKKLCKIIRSKGRFDKTAIIIISGYLAEMETDFEALSVQGTIAKGPLNEMAKNIQSLLNELNTAPPGFFCKEVMGMGDILPRRATRELLSINRHFEVILEKMAEGILEITADQRIVYANQPVLQLTEKPEEALLGSRLDELFSREDGERIGEVLRAVPDGPQYITEAAPLLLNNYLVTLSAILIDGKTQTTIIIMNNVSDRKLAEKQLKLSMETLKKSLFGTIQAMALLVERRDPYTAGHQKRVNSLACAIANEMDLDKKRLEGLSMAALIHDIGKIALPAAILSKPTHLNDMEFSLLKRHPQVAYEILNTIDFPWPLAKIVIQHHERMDGSGYPNGLSGDQIMMEARILAVADVVEAMASHRPYRPALGIDAALKEISANRGTLYDEKVVDTCLFLFKEKGFQL